MRQPWSNGVVRLPSSEHAFMLEKARLFGDSNTAQSIQLEVHPQGAKNLGRTVAGFSKAIWERERMSLMCDVLRVKFSDPNLRQLLLDTFPRVLAEASPLDLVWGIGLSSCDAEEGISWRGSNLLGECLMKVRGEMRQCETKTAEIEVPSQGFEDLFVSDRDTESDLSLLFSLSDPSCLAICSVFWNAFCTSAAADVAVHRLAGAIVHSVRQHHQFLRGVVAQKCHAARLAQLPVGLIKQLSPRWQRQWASSVPGGSTAEVKELACGILREWAQKLEATISAVSSSNLVKQVVSNDKRDSIVVPHARPPGDADLEIRIPEIEAHERADDTVSYSAAAGETELSDAAFRYIDVFAGSSAFSEQACSLQGEAVGFVEWETSDHPLLRALSPSAWIVDDFYDKQWRQFQDCNVDAMLTWPMCKHLAVCGLRRRQDDEVASQLWDTAEMAVHFNVRMVAIENVVNLGVEDATHGLFTRALGVFQQHGYVLAAVWRVDDASLGGSTWRTRLWMLLHRADLAIKVDPVAQPAMLGAVRCMRGSALPPEEVQDLVLVATVIQEPCGWSAGRCVIDWCSPLQPGTLVWVDTQPQDHCVIYHSDSGLVTVRSKDSLNPVYRTVALDRLSHSDTAVCLRSLDSPCHTVRSLPDPPGNVLLWDDRVEPAVVRMAHEIELWLFQSRCPEQLTLLIDADVNREEIIHKAGKAVTGAMAAYMAQAVQRQSRLLRAAENGCIAPQAEAWMPSARVVILHTESLSALVPCDGEMLLGGYLNAKRDSAQAVVSRWLQALLECDWYLALAGQHMVNDVPQWLFVCALPIRATVKVSQPALAWKALKSLKGCACWSLISAAHMRACEYLQPVKLSARQTLAVGVVEAPLMDMVTVRSSRTWQEWCTAATGALQLLQETLMQAANAENNDAMKEFLLSWHCQVPQFDPNVIPEELRHDIPECTGFSRVKFPCPHKPEHTKWLPRKAPQPKLCRKVGSFAELLTPQAFKQYSKFREDQTNWLTNGGPRPNMVALSELDFVDWAQGKVLDLRRLGEGIVTELDYTALTPSKFNAPAIAQSLQGYPDQEQVSFMVEGVSFKADLAPQLVLNRHLLNLEGFHEEVYEDVRKLETFGWVGAFEDSPFLPCRFNGKGQVPKGGGIRPTDEGGGPRNPSVDSKGAMVLSLNQYMDGVDSWIQAPLAQQASLQERSIKKWVSENKPGIKDVRVANAIIKEGADLCGLSVYVIKLDWFKWFNQFSLRPEEYFKSCHCFPQGFIANYCLTFGLSMASNVAQRAGNAFVWFFLQEFARLDADYLQELMDHHPQFKQWALERGQSQTMLLWMCCYTDDPLWIVAGADRVVRALKVYRAISELWGFMPAGVDKHAIGIHTTWIGITNHVFFGLSEVPPHKAAKAVLKITQALAGQLDTQEAIQMLGLLEHCRYALALSSEFKLFPMWHMVDRLEAAAPYVLAGEAQSRAETMRGFLSSARGSPIVGLVRHLPDAQRGLVLSIFSDAALVPIEEAGIGGFILGYYWRVPVDDGLHGLTIPVMELLAAGVNLILLHGLLRFPQDTQCPFRVRWEVDALAAHFVLKRDSAKSEMMQFVHAQIVKSAAFQYFKPALTLCHVFGPANPGDAPSRGKLSELNSMAAALKFNLQKITLPPPAEQMIEEVVAAGEQRAVGRSWLVDGFCRQEPPPLKPIRPKRLVEESEGWRPVSTVQVLAYKKTRLTPMRQSSLLDTANEPARLTRPMRPGVMASVSEMPLAQKLKPLRPTTMATVPMAVLDRSQQLTMALMTDSSIYALCPGNKLQLMSMCAAATGLLHRSYNFKTGKRDVAAFRKWAAYCRSIGTTPWRDDANANSGADPVGHQREVVLAINAIVHYQQTAVARPAGSSRTVVKPDTAMAWLAAVRRVFKINMIPLLPLTQIRAALKTLCREFIARFGQHSLTPKRAAPFTNEMLNAMLNCTGELVVSPRVKFHWESFTGLSMRACLAVARGSGMRKSELVAAPDHEAHALTFGNISFLMGGVLRLRPTASQLDGLAAGDFLVILPPPSKADQFGVIWGSLPIYLPFANERGNAVRLVAQIFKQRPEASSAPPLFTCDDGTTFTHRFMDSALQKWLQQIGLSPREASMYSFHSARAYLACALAAAKRPPDVIQALLRWQSIDSLRVYVALNPSDYAQHLTAAQGATVAGIRGAHVPMIDSVQMAAQLQAQV